MPVVGGGSLFRIKDFQSRSGDQFLNVYYYYSSVTPNTIPVNQILDVFEGIISAWLPPIQTTNLSHDTIEGEELTSNSNFLTRVSAIPNGTIATAPLPNFTAAAIRLLRTTKETRSGWKRYIAGGEDQLNVNIWTGGFKSALDSLAAVLNDPLVAPAGTADPVIVRQERDVNTGQLLPPSLWTYNLVSSAEAKEGVTTQNTRKLGRGI